MNLARRLAVLFMLLLFLTGMGILLYPFAHGYFVDLKIEQTAIDFLTRVEIHGEIPEASESHVIIQEPGIPEPTAPAEHQELWQDMMVYNQALYTTGQTELNCEYAYEKPCFFLQDYGVDSEVFAVVSIPALEIEMPVYLGATSKHMADGAALLSQTSIPMGGTNTNAVIAGHRGWGGASYFRYIDQLQVGDSVIITNLWEELHYVVSEIQIIQPNDVEKILIQPGRELVTLLTCHPYASGGKQRYLVICERTTNSESFLKTNINYSEESI